MKRYFFSLLLSSLLFGCSTPESLQNFDSDKWIADRMGCNGDRAILVDDLEALREDLYGKKEYILRRVLGKPDQEVLLERSERIYYYYIESGSQCSGKKEFLKPTELRSDLILWPR